MPRSLSWAVILTLFAALSVAAQSQDSSAPPPQTPSQDSATLPEAKKPKKVWTNDDVSHSNAVVSAVRDPKSKPKPISSKHTSKQDAASVRKQRDKHQAQNGAADTQL